MNIYASGLSEYNYRAAIKFYKKIGATVTPADCIRSLYSCVPVIVDNGAFSAYLKGIEFNEKIFLNLVRKIEDAYIHPNFVVLPDIVCGGMNSIRLSEKYIDQLMGHNLALAVQDGMTVDVIHPYRNVISHVFVGGSVEWKWATAKDWVDYAHKIGVKCHIARCGTINKLQYARSIGADSVDSSSWGRSNTWYYLGECFNPKQEDLYGY